MATATTSHLIHPVFRPRKPQPKLHVVPVTVTTYEGKPYQRTGPPRNNEPRPTMPKLRDGAWFGGGGSRDQVLDEVLDFLGEGEEQFEDVIRRALR